MKRLNLGCSTDLRLGYENVDIFPPCDTCVDLAKGIWPWDESSVDEIRAHDVFEHIANPDYPSFMWKPWVMNQAHRVLKPGGKLDLFIPTTDGRGAFQDPGHVTFWTPNDLFYYCEEFAEWQRFHNAYGITARFKLVPHTWASNSMVVEAQALFNGNGGAWHELYPNNVWKLRAMLEAVK